MIVEYVNYRVPSDRAEEFAAAYHRAGAYLTESPHCLRWEIRRCVEDPVRYVVRMEWDSQEGHEIGWRQDPRFREFRAIVDPFAEGRLDMMHYDLIVGSGS